MVVSLALQFPVVLADDFQSSPPFSDGNYHEYILYDVPTTSIDILVIPSASPYVLRDLETIDQSIEKWVEGIDEMAPTWLADGLEINHYTLGVDHVPPEVLVNPQIVVVSGQVNPVLLAGVGLEPFQLFGGQGPCAGLDPEGAWIEGADLHEHDEGMWSQFDQECTVGGYTCFVVNTNFMNTPSEENRRRMYDLNSHELGHCLGIGHVGDALDFSADNYPARDIMSYQAGDSAKCVSSLNILALERVYGHLLGQGGPTRPSGGYVHMHPEDWHAHECPEPTGDPLDADPVLGADPLGMDPEDEEPEPAQPEVVIEDPVQDQAVAAGPLQVSGTVDRESEGEGPLTANLDGPDSVSTDSAARYTLTAQGGASTDGYQCEITADGGASVDPVAGTDGCEVDITWSQAGTATVTGEANDTSERASDQMEVQITDPDGIPAPNGEIAGGITIFPTGFPLAYNELGAIVTTELGDPAPKFLPGTQVDLNTRFTKDSTGVAGPAESGQAVETGLSFTWHVWDSDGVLVETVDCFTTEDSGTTGAPDGFNCVGPFTMPQDFGRYFTTLRFDDDGRWSCHTGQAIFDLVPSGVPECIKAFDVVARDDVVSDADTLGGEPLTGVPPSLVDAAGAGVVPGVIGHVGDVTLDDVDEVLRVTMEMDGSFDASVPGPMGNPFVYQVAFKADHNGIEQEYALQYTYETDPAHESVIADKFSLNIHTQANAGVQSICSVDADLSASTFDVDAWEAVWVIPLAEFDHDTRTEQGDCSLSTQREGRGLQAGDVLRDIEGSATAKVGIIQFSDVKDTTLVPDYTIQSGSSASLDVASVSPGSGPTQGGTAVTISGSGFHADATLMFDDSPATEVDVKDSTQITAQTPAHAAGAVDVTVSNPDGESATLSGGYTFTEDPEPEGERVELRVDGELHDSVDVATGSSEPQAPFQGSVDLSGRSGPVNVTAHWFDEDGTLLDSTAVRVQVEAADGPAAVENLQASVHARDVTLGWDPAQNATSYVVSRDDGDGFLELAKTDETGYVDQGLEPADYSYKVHAVDDEGREGPPSAAVDVSVTDDPFVVIGSPTRDEVVEPDFNASGRFFPGNGNDSGSQAGTTATKRAQAPDGDLEHLRIPVPAGATWNAAEYNPLLPGLFWNDAIGPGTPIAMAFTPGATFPEFLCTANWVYNDHTGAVYLGAAGHCFLPEGTRTTHGDSGDVPAYDPSDVTVWACAGDCLAGGFSGDIASIFLGNYLRLGDVEYARQKPAQGSLDVDADGIGYDFGIVRIPDEMLAMVDPTMPVWGGPDDTFSGDSFLMPMALHGSGTVYGETFATKSRLGESLGSLDGRSWTALIPSFGGDSGSSVSVHSDFVPQGAPDAHGLLTHGIVGAPYATGTLIDQAIGMAFADAGLCLQPLLAGQDPDGADPAPGCEEDDPEPVEAWVQLRLDDGAWAAAGQQGNDTWNHSFADVSVGDHELQSRLVDESGSVLAEHSVSFRVADCPSPSGNGPGSQGCENGPPEGRGCDPDGGPAQCPPAQGGRS